MPSGALGPEVTSKSQTTLGNRSTEVIGVTGGGDGEVGLCFSGIPFILKFLTLETWSYNRREKEMGIRNTGRIPMRSKLGQKEVLKPVAQTIISTSYILPSWVCNPFSEILIISSVTTSALSATNASRYPCPGVNLGSVQMPVLKPEVSISRGSLPPTTNPKIRD